MRRPLYSRVFSLALSLWLPLFMGAAEWVVYCPTHGGSVNEAAATDATTASTLAEHDHGDGHSAPSGQGTSHTCSCPGPGCCAPAVADLATNTLPLAHIVAVHEAAAVATLDRLATERDHVLPFATAPPTVALAHAATLLA